MTQAVEHLALSGDLIQHSQLPSCPFPKDVFLTQIFSSDQKQQAWSVAMKKGLWPSSSKMILLKLEVMNVLQMNLCFQNSPPPSYMQGRTAAVAIVRLNLCLVKFTVISCEGSREIQSFVLL